MKKYLAYIAALLLVFIVPTFLYLYAPHLLLMWWGAITILILALLLAYYKWEKILFLILIISLPFSFPMDIGNGIRVDLPSEIIIALLACSVVLRYLFWEPNPMDRIKKSKPITKLIGMYVLWTSIAACFSEMPMVSIKSLVVQLSYILVFFVLFRDLLKEHKVGVSRIYLYYGASLIAIILYSFWNWIPYQFVSPAAILISKPFFSDHTIFSTALVFLLPLFLAYAFVVNTKYKLLFLFCSIGFFIMIVMLHARAAWISLLLSILLVGMFHLGLRMKYLYVLIGIGLIGTYAFQGDIERMIAVNQSDSSSKHADLAEETQSVININNDVSNLERINRWSCAWRMFLDKPALGFGPGTYQFQYLPYQRSSEMTRISVTSAYHKHIQGRGGSAHSEYFLRLSEAGLPAFLCYLLLWFASLTTGTKLADKETDKGKRLFIYSLMLALSSYFIHSFFNNFLETGKIAFLFWSALALLSYWDRDKERV